MHDLEIVGIKLVPDHPSGQDGDFGAENCFDSDLSTACQPATGSRKSSILIQLGNTEQCRQMQSCPLFDIKSITIYTPTDYIIGYQAYHDIKVGWKMSLWFLAVHRQLNRWPCHSLVDHSLSDWVRHLFLILRNNPRDLRLLRHLIRMMRGH